MVVVPRKCLTRDEQLEWREKNLKRTHNPVGHEPKGCPESNLLQALPPLMRKRSFESLVHERRVKKVCDPSPAKVLRGKAVLNTSSVLRMAACLVLVVVLLRRCNRASHELFFPISVHHNRVHLLGSCSPYQCPSV